jgi:transposase
VDTVAPSWPDTARIGHARQRYDRTHHLREQDLSMRAIARKLDLNFKTVRRYLRAGSVDSLPAGGAGLRARFVQALPARPARRRRA